VLSNAGFCGLNSFMDRFGCGASVFALVLMCGCSSSSDTGVASAGAGSEKGGADNAELAGNAGGKSNAAQAGNETGGVGDVGSGGTSGSGDSAGSHKIGQVVFSYYYPSGGGQPGLTASFSDGSDAGDGRCQVFTEQSCHVTLCDDTAPPAVTRPSAGVITVTSPDVSGSATIRPGTGGKYGSSVISFEGAFVGTEMVKVHALGAEVPAFDSELAMPLALLRTEPAVDSKSTHVLASRTQPLQLAWMRGVSGVSLILIAKSARVDGLPGTAALYCDFPSESGVGVVSATLLQRLAVNTMLENFTIGYQTITVGDYSVSVANSFEVYDATKTFPVQSTIQLAGP
jgi:hypothetical protein